MSTFLNHLTDISTHAMKEIWDRTPRDFQQIAIPRLLMMRCPPNRPQAMVLVQGTGGGKSAVAQTVGCVDCGVTLVIEETLALAADQKSKVGRARNLHGPVLAYQLDSVKKRHLVQKLQDKLNSLTTTTNVTLFLYTSPECLIREPWKTVVYNLIQRRVLKLVCVDEVHLFVTFGVTFRKEFLMLKNTFFRHLIDTPTTSTATTTNTMETNESNASAFYLKIPLLFMTATLNTELLMLLQKMTGIKLSPDNYLWSKRDDMARRNIRINCSYTIQRPRLIKGVLNDTLGTNLDRKCIVYTNTAASITELQTSLELWLDMEDKIKGDIIVITGDLKPEVKFASAEAFTRHIDNQQDLVNENKFLPRILLATAGSIGAGLDSSDVYAVCRSGFPTSIFEMAQELGRCGRGRSNDNGVTTDNFYLMFSLDDFVYLNTRLYKPSPPLVMNIVPTLSKVEEIEMQRKELLKLLRLIVLKGNCWHVQIEDLLGNPMEPPASDIRRCNNACPICNGTYKEYIMSVKRVGLSKFLADTFINNPTGEVTPAKLVQKLIKYPNVGKTIYNRDRSNKSPPAKFVNTTVLQLIASELVRMEIDLEQKCTLCLCVTDLIPAYMNDTAWQQMYIVDEPNPE